MRSRYRQIFAPTALVGSPPLPQKRIRSMRKNSLRLPGTGPGPLGVPHQGFIEHDAEVTGSLPHFLEHAAAPWSRLTSATPSESNGFEGEPDALGRVLDAGKRVGDLAAQVLAAAEVPALVTERDAHLRQRVPRLARHDREARRTDAGAARVPDPGLHDLPRHVPFAASAARRVKRCSAMSSVCCSTPTRDAASRRSCNASTPIPILLAVSQIASAR